MRALLLLLAPALSLACPAGQIVLFSGSCVPYPTPDSVAAAALSNNGAGIVLGTGNARLSPGQLYQVDMFLNSGAYTANVYGYRVYFPAASLLLASYYQSTGVISNPAFAAPMVIYDSAVPMLGVGAVSCLSLPDCTGGSVWLGSFQVQADPNFDVWTYPFYWVISHAFTSCTTLYVVNTGNYQYVTNGNCGPFPTCGPNTYGCTCAPCPGILVAPTTSQFNTCVCPAGTQPPSCTPCVAGTNFSATPNTACTPCRQCTLPANATGTLCTPSTDTTCVTCTACGPGTFVSPLV